jgi:hypothetical protein
MADEQIDRINGLVGSIAVKAPCKVATTEDITLSGEQTIDGIALTADETPRQRVLVKDQTDDTENGIYDVNSGDWTRSPDFDGSRDAVDGTQVLINEGSTAFAKAYRLDATNPVSIGTDSLSFDVIPGYGFTLEDDPDPTLSAPLDTNSLQIKESFGANVASATELPILTDGNTFIITGTTEIETIVDIAAGTRITCIHAGSHNLKHSASLILKNDGDDIAAVAGDVSTWVQKTSTIWEMTGFIKSDGSFLSSKLAAPLDTNSFQSQWSKGADVASAAELPILTDGNSFDVTGTTTITSIATTGRIGTWIMLQFDNVLTLTHHATNLILPGGENITTAAGDLALCYEYASGDWQVIYQKASGKAVIETGITLGTAVATTSGTEVDYTGIPSGTKQITVNFDGISSDGTSNYLVQIGDAGGIETTGYLSVMQTAAGDTNETTGFAIRNLSGAAYAISGQMILSLLDATTFTWTMLGGQHNTGGGGANLAGSKSLSAELTQLRITTVNGTDVFDAGKVNISYQQ